MLLKNSSAEKVTVVYANWPEGYVNQRFIDALNQRYAVSTFFFGETGTEIDRVRNQSITIPLGVEKIIVKDPPLINFPVKLKFATKKGNIGWILKFFTRALLFRRTIRNLRPNLVIGNGVSGTNPYGFCCAFSGYHPFIVLVWGSDVLLEAKNSCVFRFIAKFILRQADAVLVDSKVKESAAVQLGCSPKKIWRFPWGVDLKLFNSISKYSRLKEQLGWNTNKVVISTRNHYPIYGIEYLIRAIPAVISEVKNARFLIVGDGPTTKSLKEESERLGIGKYVLFVGNVPNEEISEYLKISNVYVSTAFSDGASNSLLEAMACSLPVVATDIPGNQEWIQNGKNGFLVPAKNSKELAEKIAFLLKDEEMMKFFGSTNSELARAHADWEKNIDILYQTVEHLAIQ
jgi:L-malate glycosyltransferase